MLVYHFGPIDTDAVRLGAIGVHLFFVISGFLITSKLLAGREAIARGEARRAAVLGDFYVRRARRILPIYLLVIACSAIVGMPTVRADWPWLVTWTGNLRTVYTGHFLGYLAATWTLNIEEQFYVAWPWVVLGAARHLPFVVYGVISLGPLWRGVATAAGVSKKSVDVFTLAAFDGLGIGALLAIRWHTHGGDLAPRLSAVVAVLGLGLVLYGTFGEQRAVAESVWTLGVTLVSVWLVDGAARGFRGPVGRLLAARPIVYLGVISYGVYLYHLPTLWATERVAARMGTTVDALSPLPRFLLLTGLSIGVAAASWEFLERRLISSASRR